jgi:FlaA1/EpsC-like NDP-sugar epimerase
MVKALFLKYRRFLIISFHIVLIVPSNYLAFWIRFDGNIPERELALFFEMIPWLVLVRGLIFVRFQIYRGLWRYAGIWDLRNVIAAATVSTVVFYIPVYWIVGVEGYPRSIAIIDSLVLIFLMGGSRLSYRLWNSTKGKSEKRVLIYGAGDAGEMIVRDMRNNGGSYYAEPMGFLDDDPLKLGRRIHGVPVLGTGDQLHEILRSHRVDELLLAIPSALPSLARRVLTQLEPYRIVIKTVPSSARGPGRKVGVRQIQDLSVQDLLERLPVGTDLTPVENLLKGKRILITGAGGSIGSELSRQIAQYHPARLMLLDHSESALYDIEMELQGLRPDMSLVARLADVKNTRALSQIFSQETPQIVFHAAAYKHVPMMEHHPTEAVLNNIVGTYRVMQLAVEHKVETFVLISTDKAVNPTNVMGATKRVNEMCVQAMAKNGRCAQSIFSAVRFGNVLGSNGSVVPLFLKQIEQGGPVTVTHPEVMRYFMTIPEAVVLVLQAATLARGGEIFVLEMGEQIKLMEMARHLIRLAGFLPDEEIAIQIVGLRPGEKLREELVAMDETIVPSEVDKIMRVQSGWVADVDSFTQKIEALERLAMDGQSRRALELLYEMVPTFRPLDTVTSEHLRRRRARSDGLRNMRIASQPT